MANFSVLVALVIFDIYILKAVQRAHALHVSVLITCTPLLWRMVGYPPPPMWHVIAWSIWNALPQLHSIGVFSSTHQCSVIATPNSGYTSKATPIHDTCACEM